MKINYNIPNLSWEFIDKLRYMTPDNKTIIETKIESKINEYLDTISLIIKLINETNTLSDEEFINLLKSVCDISFNKSDILEVLSIAYNKNFTNYQTIYTTMISTVVETEGHGHSFDWWEEDVRTIYKVACEEDFQVDPDKTYSIKELQDLLDNKKIVIVKENAIELEEYIENKEEYKQFKILDSSTFLKKESEFFLSAIKYIKSYITKEKITSRLIRHIEKLEEDIEELEYASQVHNYLFEETPSIIIPILNNINYQERLEIIKKSLGIDKDTTHKLTRKMN